MRVAVVDIGTNSVLLLVADVFGSKIDEIVSGIMEPRLGENLVRDGIISNEALARTTEAIRKLYKRAKKYNPDKIILFGTGVFRGAKNGAEIARKIENEIGYPLRILTEEEEARYSFIGALGGLPFFPQNTVVDVGGGSTEIAIGGKTPQFVASMPLGCVGATEKFSVIPPLSGKMKIELLKSIRELMPDFANIQRESRLVGVGGTITTLAGIELKQKKYNPKKVHGYSLTFEKIENIYNRFSSMTVDEIKKQIPFAPERGQIILAGTAIFIEIMRRINMSEITVSDRGARWGIISVDY